MNMIMMMMMMMMMMREDKIDEAGNRYEVYDD